VERTPGYSSWQSQVWPDCCGDATAFMGVYGAKEIREAQRLGEDLKQPLLKHIRESLRYEAPAAALLLDTLDRDKGPAAYHFECLHCSRRIFHIDFP